MREWIVGVGRILGFWFSNVWFMEELNVIIVCEEVEVFVGFVDVHVCV